MKRILLLTFATLSIISCKNKAELDAESAKSRAKTSQAEMTADTISETEPIHKLTTAEAIAYASGLEHWNAVNELQFTFNVKRGDNPPFSRHWKWNPKTNDVAMMTAADTVMYNRTSMDSISMKADQAFINDKYWLHAPFNLVWDDGTTITEKESQTAPISGEKMDMLTITYGSDGGYTPGDAYDLYYDSDFMVKEWVFRKSNQADASLMTTWEDYKAHDGIQFAQMHQDSTGGFKLYFTNVSLKTEKKEVSKKEIKKAH